MMPCRRRAALGRCCHVCMEDVFKSCGNQSRVLARSPASCGEAFPFRVSRANTSHSALSQARSRRLSCCRSRASQPTDSSFKVPSMPVGVPEVVALLERLTSHMRENGEAILAATQRIEATVDEAWHHNPASVGRREIESACARTGRVRLGPFSSDRKLIRQANG